MTAETVRPEERRSSRSLDFFITPLTGRPREILMLRDGYVWSSDSARMTDARTQAPELDHAFAAAGACCLAEVHSAAKPSASRTAMSARILRSRSMPPAFSPWINWL